MSRPTKLSTLAAEDQAKLCALLRIGTPQKWACKAIGLSYDTLVSYRKRAAQGEEPYRAFIRDVEQAQAGYVIERLRIIDADAIGAPLTEGRERGDSRALKWLLERLFPKDFGWRRMRQEHTSKRGAPLVSRPARLVIARKQRSHSARVPASAAGSVHDP